MNNPITRPLARRAAITRMAAATEPPRESWRLVGVSQADVADSAS